MKPRGAQHLDRTRYLIYFGLGLNHQTRLSDNQDIYQITRYSIGHMLFPGKFHSTKHNAVLRLQFINNML